MRRNWQIGSPSGQSPTTCMALRTMFKVIGYLVAIFCPNGFGNLITHLKFFQNQLVNSVAIGYFNLVVMLIRPLGE